MTTFALGLASLTLGHYLRTHKPAKRATAPAAPAADRLTCQAAAALIARDIYAEALTYDNPAAALDDICDALPEVMPQVFKTLGTSPDKAAVMLPEITDRLWAFTAIEHARIEAGDGYGYLFDYLADGLRKGADPKLIRKDALAAPARIRDTGGFR